MWKSPKHKHITYADAGCEVLLILFSRSSFHFQSEEYRYCSWTKRSPAMRSICCPEGRFWVVQRRPQACFSSELQDLCLLCCLNAELQAHRNTHCAVGCGLTSFDMSHLGWSFLKMMCSLVPCIPLSVGKKRSLSDHLHKVNYCYFSTVIGLCQWAIVGSEDVEV